MQIMTEMTDDILIARLEGELDHHSAADVRSTIDETIDAFHGRHLIFCFEKISFMDSAGIGVVMGRYNKVRDNGGVVYVTECTGYVKRILSMAGIFTIVEYCDTVEQAISKCRQVLAEGENREEEQQGIQTR